MKTLFKFNHRSLEKLILIVNQTKLQVTANGFLQVTRLKELIRQYLNWSRYEVKIFEYSCTLKSIKHLYSPKLWRVGFPGYNHIQDMVGQNWK